MSMKNVLEYRKQHIKLTLNIDQIKELIALVSNKIMDLSDKERKENLQKMLKQFNVKIKRFDEEENDPKLAVRHFFNGFIQKLGEVKKDCEGRSGFKDYIAQLEQIQKSYMLEIMIEMNH